MESSTTDTTERTFYQDTTVRVTQSRFVSEAKTYAMRNISSVQLYRQEKSRLFQIVLTLAGIAMWFDSDTAGVGIVAAAIGGVWLFFTKDSYAVRINSNSGETNGFISPDKERVKKIVDAVNEAIIFRG